MGWISISFPSSGSIGRLVVVSRKGLCVVEGGALYNPLYAVVGNRGDGVEVGSENGAGVEYS